jgi:hypothetical protein
MSNKHLKIKNQTNSYDESTTTTDSTSTKEPPNNECAVSDPLGICFIFIFSSARPPGFANATCHLFT